MKHSYLFTLVLLVSLAFSSDIFGQFKLTAEVRPRAEFRNGFKSPIEKGVDPAFFVEQRTRLYTDYTSEKFDFSMSVQDVRIWGAVGQVYKQDPSLFNVYEAYGTYHISSKHHIAAGRMSLDYDNARILGNLDWAQQGRSHDLLKYTYVAPTFHLDVGVAFNQDASVPENTKLTGTYFSGVNNYKTMQYARAHKSFENAKLSLLALNNGMQYAPDTVYYSQTIGAYFVPQLGKTSLELEVYFQGGKDGVGRDLRAFMLAASWSFMKNKPLSMSAGFDFLSGDDPGTTHNEGFNPLYGTHHKFYGFMDYFYVGNGHGNTGLIDLNLKAKVKTSEKTSLLIQGHQFLAQAKIPGGETHGNDISKNLGTEIDLVFNADLAPNIKLIVGYSQMLHTDSMNAIKGKSDTRGFQNWAWAMLVIKPTLFDSSIK